MWKSKKSTKSIVLPTNNSIKNGEIYKKIYLKKIKRTWEERVEIWLAVGES